MSSQRDLARQPDYVGARIARLRNALNMTQVDFARETGLMRQTLSGIEMGYRHPTIKQAYLIKNRWRVGLEWIFDDDLTTTNTEIAEAILKTLMPKPVYDPLNQKWRDSDDEEAAETLKLKSKLRVL